MSQWPESLSALIEQGETSVLITIVDAKGSVPRGAGTKMIVTEQGIHHGTIGGGNLEYQCIGMAQKRLALLDGDDQWQRKVHRFPLGASLGQCCGGMVIVLFELIPAVQQEWLTRLLQYKAKRVKASLSTPLNDPLKPKEVNICTLLKPQSIVINESSNQDKEYLVETVEVNSFNIVIFGAGHVGRALVNVLSSLECQVTWVDSREAEFPDSSSANVTKVIDPNPEDSVKDTPVGSYYIILTHSHSLDLLLCERVLKRGDFSLCGLIGSKSKRVKFEHRLQDKGFTKEEIARLTCPIGINGINGKQPAQIAVSVAAQLLILQEAGST